MKQSNLEGNGIFIRENPIEIAWHRSPHILAFQHAILDFDWSAADTLADWSDGQVRRFDELPPAEIGIPDLERAWVSETLKDYADVVERAEQLAGAGVFGRQHEWKTFFRGVFLTPLTQESAHVRHMDPRSSNGHVQLPTKCANRTTANTVKAITNQILLRSHGRVSGNPIPQLNETDLESQVLAISPGLSLSTHSRFRRNIV